MLFYVGDPHGLLMAVFLRVVGGMRGTGVPDRQPVVALTRVFLLMSSNCDSSTALEVLMRSMILWDRMGDSFSHASGVAVGPGPCHRKDVSQTHSR